MRKGLLMSAAGLLLAGSGTAYGACTPAAPVLRCWTVPVSGINTAVRNVRAAGWHVCSIRVNIFVRSRVLIRLRKQPATRSVKTWATRPVPRTAQYITRAVAAANAEQVISVRTVLVRRPVTILIRRRVARHSARALVRLLA